MIVLSVAETMLGVWHYHLREVWDEKLYLGGGAPPALCGAKLGWDTKIPVSSWGCFDDVPSKWCEECERLRASLPAS